MAEADSPARTIAWLRRTHPVLSTLGPFALLEIEPIDDEEAITAAYRRIVDSRHPALLRHHLGRVELAMLEAVLAAVTAAYHQLLDVHARRRLGAPPRRMPRGTSTPAPAPGPEPPRRPAARAMHLARQAQAALELGQVTTALLYLRM